MTSYLHTGFDDGQVAIWLGQQKALLLGGDRRLQLYYLEPSNPDAALTHLLSLDLDSHNLEMLAQDLMQHKRWLEAALVYERMLEKNPQRSELLLSIGRAYKEAGATEQARAAWQQLISRAPTSTEARQAQQYLNP
jgi:tetratricopeptide (TPR) repeat protein